MVDPGEEVSATLLREFMEEAVNYKIEQATSLAHLNREQKLHKVKELFFKEGREVSPANLILKPCSITLKCYFGFYY